MAIYIGPPKSLEELAAFLEIINKDDTTHIGYCGEKKIEILVTLSNDFSDLDIEKSFVVAYEKGNIVGALGFDVDAERRIAEVWGPFIDNGKDNIEIANDLWEELETSMSFNINEYQFFVNEKNTFAKKFIEGRNGFESGHHLVLRAHRNSQTEDQDKKHIKNYAASCFQSFKALHSLSFPNTYYNSEEILARVSNDNRLIIIQHNNELKGYVYVEANSLQGEGAIEYIAVAPESRGQGIAKKLMKDALNHLFSYASIEEITLSVEANNKAAIALYKASGFQVKYTLVAYKKVDNNHLDREVRSS